MAARQILRMGDPRLLTPAQPLETFGTLALTKEGSRNALIRRHRMQEEGGR